MSVVVGHEPSHAAKKMRRIVGGCREEFVRVPDPSPFQGDAALGQLRRARHHAGSARSPRSVGAGGATDVRGNPGASAGHDHGARSQARANSAPTTRADNGARRRRTQTARQPEPTHGAKGLHAIAGCPHRHGRHLRQQHVGGDQDQYPAGEHSAVAQRHHQGLHPGYRRHWASPMSPATFRASRCIRAKATATNS